MNRLLFISLTCLYFFIFQTYADETTVRWNKSTKLKRLNKIRKKIHTTLIQNLS